MDNMTANLRKYSLYALVAVLIGALTYLLIGFINSRPPHEFTIATGREGGAYYQFAMQYRDIVAGEGYTLNIRPTAGSVETLELLNRGEVDVGFVQSGTAAGTDVSTLHSLASVFYEPLWIFYNRENYAAPEILPGMTNVRIGIGEEGSGTNQAARFILGENGITDENADLISGPSAEQARQLAAGTLDVAMLISSPEAPLINEMLNNMDLGIFGVRRQEAYTSRYSGIAPLTLGEGAIDLRENIPDEDVDLISTVAVLVSNSEFHPDLARLLLAAAIDVHSPGALFEAPGQFPSTDFVEIPMSSDAAKYLETGPTGLERFLPFWLATRLERVVFLVLPALLLFYPFFRSAPLMVQFVVRFRIAQSYKTVRQIEQEIDSYGVKEIDEKLIYLEEMQQQLTENFRVPLLYLDSFYNLRLHLNLVIQRLRERRAMLTGEAYEAPTLAETLRSAGSVPTAAPEGT
jgi:TRAP-type uncharacterized transport system substrate-binding protein